MISIIVTAYKNTSYIKETLESIINSCGDLEYEILIGIDNCIETMKFLISIKNQLSDKVKILFFTKKVGTYIIRNTLVKNSTYEKLLFFDSDDVMTSTLASNVVNALDNYEYVRYRYITFRDNYVNYINNAPANHYHVGTFGINKKVFMSLNGFEPWDCAADGEFFWRVTANKIRVKTLDSVGLYYRKHTESLTSNPNTGMNSPIRKYYHDKKHKKQSNNNFGPLDDLVISDFILYANDDSFLLEYFVRPKISIIVPTFKNPTMLSECLNSIRGYSDCEILVGIDGCEETLEYVKKNKHNENIRFFYFDKNNGPYIVRNSLAKISNSDILLFFDSDDIMKENMISDILGRMSSNDFVKPMYSDFTNTPNYNINKSNTYGEGVFAIKKDLFLSMNGFEPWPIAADSDFMVRLYKNNKKFSYTTDVVFYRRVHSNSLTQRKDTGLSSPLRNKYYSMSKRKSNFNPLQELVTATFYDVYTNKIHNTETTIEITPKKDISQTILIHPKTIDYGKINEILGKKPEQKVQPNQKPQTPQNKPVSRNVVNDNKNSQRHNLAKMSIKKK
jgi:glycosyltransferase involved in cell wall biosynthesis